MLDRMEKAIELLEKLARLHKRLASVPNCRVKDEIKKVLDKLPESDAFKALLVDTNPISEMKDPASAGLLVKAYELGKSTGEAPAQPIDVEGPKQGCSDNDLPRKKGESFFEYQKRKRKQTS